jgi:hypothetical protein
LTGLRTKKIPAKRRLEALAPFGELRLTEFTEGSANFFSRRADFPIYVAAFEANQFSIRFAKGVENNHQVETGKTGTGKA